MSKQKALQLIGPQALTIPPKPDELEKRVKQETPEYTVPELEDRIHALLVMNEGNMLERVVIVTDTNGTNLTKRTNHLARALYPGTRRGRDIFKDSHIVDQSSSNRAQKDLSILIDEIQASKILGVEPEMMQSAYIESLIHEKRLPALLELSRSFVDTVVGSYASVYYMFPSVLGEMKKHWMRMLPNEIVSQSLANFGLTTNELDNIAGTDKEDELVTHALEKAAEIYNSQDIRSRYEKFLDQDDFDKLRFIATTRAVLFESASKQFFQGLALALPTQEGELSTYRQITQVDAIYQQRINTMGAPLSSESRRAKIERRLSKLLKIIRSLSSDEETLISSKPIEIIQDGFTEEEQVYLQHQMMGLLAELYEGTSDHTQENLLRYAALGNQLGTEGLTYQQRDLIRAEKNQIMQTILEEMEITAKRAIGGYYAIGRKLNRSPFSTETKKVLRQLRPELIEQHLNFLTTSSIFYLESNIGKAGFVDPYTYILETHKNLGPLMDFLKDRPNEARIIYASLLKAYRGVDTALLQGEDCSYGSFARIDFGTLSIEGTVRPDSKVFRDINDRNKQFIRFLESSNKFDDISQRLAKELKQIYYGNQAAITSELRSELQREFENFKRTSGDIQDITLEMLEIKTNSRSPKSRREVVRRVLGLMGAMVRSSRPLSGVDMRRRDWYLSIYNPFVTLGLVGNLNLQTKALFTLNNSLEYNRKLRSLRNGFQSGYPSHDLEDMPFIEEMNYIDVILAVVRELRYENLEASDGGEIDDPDILNIVPF